MRGIPDVRVVRIENFLAVVAKDEWAAVRAARALKATWSEAQALPRAATGWSGGRVRRRSIAIRRSSIAATRLRRSAGAREETLRDLLLAVPEPRVARPLLRRRRRARRRQRHHLVGVSGDARPARESVEGLRAVAGQSARGVPRRIGIVRHQRRRSRRRRRGPAVENARPAGARAVDASGRTRLGSERARSSCSTSRPRSTRTAASSRGTPRCGCPLSAGRACAARRRRRRAAAGSRSGRRRDHAERRSAVPGRERPRRWCTG